MNLTAENTPDLIKYIRKHLNLSQEDLAHSIGVSFATINRWENGKSTPSKLARKELTSFYEKMNLHAPNLGE